MYKVPWALAPFLFIPGLAFEALVRGRRALYASAVLPQRRLSKPVISIGNITLGGTGKTPLVVYVAQTLSKLGITPVVLSRGYGRFASGTSQVIPPGKEIPDPARRLGDEPALIRRRIPHAWMGLSKDRFKIASAIEGQGLKMAFILDDGFQHQQLCRDLDIVIIDPTQPLKSNRVFPRGTLREPLSGLRRCHAIVMNGTSPPDARDPVETELRSLHLKAAVFRCEQKIDALVPLAAWQKAEPHGPGNDTRVQSAYLVAALGNPMRFLLDVQRLGIEVRGTGFFPDHYRLERADWVACADQARMKAADALITTEKDAVKIAHPPDFPLLVSVQSTRISEPAAFEHFLRRCLEQES